MYKSTPLYKFLQNKLTKIRLDKLFITTKYFMFAYRHKILLYQ